MNTTASFSNAANPAITYEFQLAGHLDDHWLAWFGGHTLVRNDDVSTTLTAEIADQAQLHGLLAGIRDVGVTLLSLNLVDAAADASRESNQPPKVAAPTEQTEPPVPSPAHPLLDRTLHTDRLTLRPAVIDDADAT